MKTQETTFSSNQNSVSNEDVKKAYESLDLKRTYGVKELNLYDISRKPSGRGHYKVVFEFKVDGEDFKVIETTSNVELINDFEIAMGDYIGDFSEEKKDDIVNSMLGLADEKLGDKLDELN